MLADVNSTTEGLTAMRHPYHGGNGIKMKSTKNPHVQDLATLPALKVFQVQSQNDFQLYELGTMALLKRFQSVLLDDFTAGDVQHLVDNTRGYCPWLWLLVSADPEPSARVYGLIALSDIIPGRHAFVHGVSHPEIRKHPAIHQLAREVLSIAFNDLKVHKVKAEIEADNIGAKGFCRRMGFTREAHFRQDNKLGGQWHDVLVYSLLAKQFNPPIKAQCH
jgi:RimJ/RimL family protein N-acetyltransferase